MIHRSAAAIPLPGPRLGVGAGLMLGRRMGLTIGLVIGVLAGGPARATAAEAPSRALAEMLAGDGPITGSTSAPDSTRSFEPIAIPELTPVTDPRTGRPRGTERGNEREPGREPRREPFAYAGRSLLLPGWGQHAIGDGPGAMRFALVSTFFVPFAVGIAPFPFIDDDAFSRKLGLAGWATVAVLAAFDAFKEAESVNRENGYLLDDELFDDARAAPPTTRFAVLQRRF